MLSHFSQFGLNQFLPKHIGTGYLVNATPSIILPGSILNVAAVFVTSGDVHVIGYYMDFLL